MTQEIDWLKVLVQAKNSIQKQMAMPLKKLGQPQSCSGIGAGGDPIKQIDFAAENAIVETLTSCEVSFTLISEESGIKEHGKTPHKHYVTVDPIDGTANFMRGIPFYATSLAVSTKPILSTVYAALVADLARDITYVAQKGKGAYRDSKAIVPSRGTFLKEAVIGMDLNTFAIREMVPQLASLIRKTKHLRHLGANALELCYVADGTTDAFIDIRGKLRATDMAAAWLIIKEAGAEITTLEGKAIDITLSPKQTTAFVASANERIHKAILELINPKKEEK